MDVTVSSTHDAPQTNPGSPALDTWPLSISCREVRLGLVVYGGVSLAIYINGVADELFRAVRGRGVYKLLKRLLDADIVVDIISGTSAGGINGLLLAYALTNEREFSASANLWRDHGSLAKLLRLVDDQANATSLLDSQNYYIPHLENAFRNMPSIAAADRQTERVSRFDELDVFVTGTNFDGQMSTAVDATGRQIDIKSHRTVFHLKHRARRKTPFAVTSERTSAGDRHTIAALARLAAVTSCFPAAFEPVRIAPAPDNPNEQAVYDLLKEWGRLDGEGWFIDGGVLDNKPFSYTVKEIYKRTASRPVERKLFYVEPDPERFDPARPLRPGAPSIVESATEALLGIPGYESIAEDLEHIAIRNDRLRRQTQVRARAQSAFEHLRTPNQDGGAPALPPSVAAIYRQARLAQLAERAVKGLMEGQGFRRSLEVYRTPVSPAVRRANAEADQERRAIAAALARAFNEWEGEGDETLERFDPYFRLRRVFHVVYRVADQVSARCNSAAGPGTVEKLRVAWETLNQQLAAYEIVVWAMEEAIDQHPMPADANDARNARRVWQQLEATLEHLLKVDEDLERALLPQRDANGAAGCSETQRNQLHAVLGKRLSAGARHEEVAVASVNLLQLLDRHTRSLIGEQLASVPALISEWDDFIVYDAHFFPIDYFADLGEKDPIDVVRISPLDAERAFSNRTFEDKVTGETVMHFGSFLKRSWRSNDIMWGRLDGVCRILDALLTAEALSAAVAKPAVRDLLRKDIANGVLDPTVLFPSAGKAIQTQIATWLRRLALDDDDDRARAARDPEMRTLLLWCAQLEILDSDLPTVLADAARDQLEWNNLAVEDGRGATTFTPLSSRVDLSLALTAGEELTRQFIERLKKNPSQFSQVSDAPLAKYFLQKYAVGAENPRDSIPPSVLLETITAALLVTRNCLVRAFPQYSGTVTSSFMYKVLVDWPLRTAHTFAVLARRERPLYVAGVAALVTYAVVALLVALRWPRQTLTSDSAVNVTNLVLFVIAPLMVLLPGMQLAWARAYRDAKRSAIAQAALVTLAFLGVCLALIVAGAFAVAWSATNAQLALWIARLGLAEYPGMAWLQTYALAALVIVLLLVIPAVRGFVQARVTRVAARPSSDQSRRSLVRTSLIAVRAMLSPEKDRNPIPPSGRSILAKSGTGTVHESSSPRSPLS
jgi:patatin-related protein